MLVVVPILVGLLIGGAVYYLTKELEEKKPDAKYVPSVWAIAISVFLIPFSMIVIRGLEGAAYLILATVILGVSLYTLYKT
ncbi:hypothetical protein FLK61_24000 [Paenalkalicoccus suaedae]|uniref:Uncharacterized protein n=1 Tax=Paenalkalicoccus suaedae TaxID=2592382 RepID=A0A859F9L3_9BACI|nr:YesK family protein [Paenalkalicoccus suaedae]QKS69853.1 hypothetical protein FLK61_24000 [Paenalkalicoccus suaedae]